MNQAKNEHVEKISEAEKQCKKNNRKAIEDAEKANQEKIKAKKEALEADRISIKKSQ
jgi:vacuolar-type H+-ATPase subunit H